MKSYEALKTELSARRKNIKGFNQAFYKQFAHDMETARKAVEEADRLNVKFSVTDFWRQSETHKTYFYQKNSGAYCELLQIIE